MLSVRRSLFLDAVLAASLMAAAMSLSAQDSLRIEGTRVDRSPLEQRLASRVSLSFGPLSLEGLAELLRQQFSISVVLDRRALDDVGLGPETTVPAFDLSHVVLEDVLCSVLKECDLTIVVRDEVLVITTPEEAENELETRVYPVADLVFVRRSARDARDPQSDDYDTLIATILSAIAPDTWDEVGGAGAMAPFPASRALVISQTRGVHRQVTPLLEALRRAKTLSRTVVGDGLGNHSAVGSRPYTPRSAAPVAAHSPRSSRYVYRPCGAWQEPSRPD